VSVVDSSDAGRVGSAGPELKLPLLRVRDIRRYRVSDSLSGILIAFMIVFSPWALGTTQSATIRIMNLTGYALGVLLLVKWYIRRFKGYRPPQWGGEAIPALLKLNAFLAALTVAILAFCLTSALNARASWQPELARFEYHDAIAWLPQSYDQASTWRAFQNFLALACFFWAVRDWLPGKTTGEEHSRHKSNGGVNPDQTAYLPARLRGLLWVLCLSGALLAVEGIAQRLSDTNKLLWLVETRLNREASSQFGPYAYRANAAQYFNLVWPVCLGFWWTLHRAGGFKRWRHHLLLPCGMVMAAAPIISTARGGALVAGGMLVLAALYLMVAPILLPARPRHSLVVSMVTLAVLAAFFVGAAFLAIQLGWDPLEKRMTELQSGYELRESIYETARGMAKDYRWFGTGPGTFDPLFQLYRRSPDEYWPAQLHNDWLETRITFGRVGSGLIAAAFLTVLARWFLPGGIHGGRRFVALLWLSLTGCLIQARFDFPFQVYSVLLLFLLVCAILSSLSRRGA
jgi:O-antigen ligase